MCIGGKSQPKAEDPAAAPAPPLEAPEAPEIGDARRKETMDNFGADAPNYRVDRSAKPKVTPSGPIKM